MKEARAGWREKFADVRPEDLVFIDESGADTAMHTTHGYAPQGERLIDKAPEGDWKTVTFLGGLSADGIRAPWAQDEPMNGAVFLAYVEQILVPALRPGMVVIMDNLSSHKVAGRRSRRRGAGWSTCRRTAPTSTRSRGCSASSSASCGEPPRGRSRGCTRRCGPR